MGLRTIRYILIFEHVKNMAKYGRTWQNMAEYMQYMEKHGPSRYKLILKYASFSSKTGSALATFQCRQVP
jgi:hypothetical protein